jgi:hypothetical protein
MSRPQTPPQHSASVPHDKIAMRAYQKWLQRGCPNGSDKQDWHEAEAELKAEMGRTGQQSQTRH